MAYVECFNGRQSGGRQYALEVHQGPSEFLCNRQIAVELAKTPPNYERTAALVNQAWQQTPWASFVHAAAAFAETPPFQTVPLRERSAIGTWVGERCQQWGIKQVALYPYLVDIFLSEQLAIAGAIVEKQGSKEQAPNGKTQGNGTVVVRDKQLLGVASAEVQAPMSFEQIEATLEYIEELRPMLERYMQKHFGIPWADAQDLVSELEFKAFSQMEQGAFRYRNMYALQGWLYRVVGNKAIDWRRSQRSLAGQTTFSDAFAFANVPSDELFPVEEEGYEALLAQDAYRRLLGETLLYLSPEQRTVFVLRTVFGMPKLSVMRLVSPTEHRERHSREQERKR